MVNTAKPVHQIVKELQADIEPEENFRQLFETYYGPLYRFFLFHGFAPEESNDLIQDTFLNVYTGIKNFRGQSRFETWLFLIATNSYRNRLRRKTAHKRAGYTIPLDEMTVRERTESLEIGSGSTSSDPLQSVLRREEARWVRQAVEELPDQMRKCLLLHFYQGLSYSEVAVVLRVSAETVKTHIFKAKQKLRMRLSSDADQPDAAGERGG